VPARAPRCALRSGLRDDAAPFRGPGASAEADRGRGFSGPARVPRL